MSKVRINYSLSGSYDVPLSHLNKEPNFKNSYEIRIFAQTSLDDQSSLDLMSNLDILRSRFPRGCSLDSAMVIKEDQHE